MNTLSKTRDLVLAAVIAAIIVIMAFVPFLGYIPLGFMNATTVHIPVIIGAIILGPKYGAFLGLTFGLTSLWKNTFMPNPRPLCFHPLLPWDSFTKSGKPGYLPGSKNTDWGCGHYVLYRLFMRTLKNRRNKQGTALFAAGVPDPDQHLLVMNLIYFLFGDQYASAASWTAKWVYGVILGIIGMQGVPSPGGRNYCDGCSGILLKLTPDIRG